MSRVAAICAKKEVCNFHEFHTAGALVGLLCAVKVWKKNCRIHFPCRNKNVIMIAYGKTVCSSCPVIDILVGGRRERASGYKKNCSKSITRETWELWSELSCKNAERKDK